MSVGGHCIPVYPRLYLWNDPEATVVRAARAANADMPAYTVGLAAELAGVWPASGWRCSVPATGAGSRRPRSRASSPPSPRSTRLGGVALVHDPMYTDAELEKLGFTAYHLGDPVDVVLVHTNHADYADTTAADFPGCRCSSTAVRS
jgi:hypothetical protein